MSNAVKFRPISQLLISTAIIAMLSLGLVFHKLTGISVLIILLISLVGLWVTRKDDYSSLCQWEKWWLASILFYFVLIALDIFIGYGSVRDLDSPSRLVLAIPVFLYIRRVGLDINMIWIASAIGAIISGLYAGYQYEILGISRAEGFTSPIYFGQIAIILTIFSFIGFALNKRPLIHILLFLAVVMGLYAAFVSGSRGGWVAIPTIIILFLSVSKKTSLSKKFGYLIVITGVLYAAYQSPKLPVKPRIDLAINEFIAYYQDDKVEGSVGIRLELWKAAWLMSKESNFMGVGEDRFRQNVTKLIQEEKVHKGLDRWRIPHNQYLNSLSEQGLAGLFSLLAMMLIPLKVGLHHVRRESDNKVIALFSVALIVSYMDFMLTLATLERALMVTTYAFLVSILMGLLTHNKQQAITK